MLKKIIDALRGNPNGIEYPTGGLGDARWFVPGSMCEKNGLVDQGAQFFRVEKTLGILVYPKSS
jgi:hypothetical protein